MVIFKNASQLSAYVQKMKNEDRIIGFVPTMGALHKGHLTLVETSKKTDTLTVASIFVNPTQFNNPDDLKHYPVTIERDIEMLLEAGCNVLFLPSVDEIYPPDYTKKLYALGELEHRLEGFYRPGHFQGVCQVVDRLLDIVSPHHLYLGQKDFQQCMVIRKMLELTGKEKQITLSIVPTQREANGLAMSSRNMRLDPEQKELAAAIFRELSNVKKQLGSRPPDELKKTAADRLVEQGFTVDYVEIANQHDLSPARDRSGQLVVLAAASIGNVRLIDNLLLI